MRKTQEISIHVRKRTHQRALTDDVLPFCCECGAHQSAGHGCKKWALTRKAIEQLRRDMQDVLARRNPAQYTYPIEAAGGRFLVGRHSHQSSNSRRRQ